MQRSSKKKKTFSVLLGIRKIWIKRIEGSISYQIDNNLYWMVLKKETFLHTLARRLSLRQHNACFYCLHRKNRLYTCVNHPAIKETQFQTLYPFTLQTRNSRGHLIPFTFPGLSWNCTLYNPCSQTWHPSSFLTIKVLFRRNNNRVKRRRFLCWISVQRNWDNQQRQLRIPLELG